MADQPDAHDTATQLGRLEAERFDLRLRERERQDLAERWPRASWSVEAAKTPPAVDLHTLHQLEQLIQYQLAVQKSWAWRVVQMLRKPFGRQW